MLTKKAQVPFRAISTGQVRGLNPWQAARNLGRMRRGAAESAEIIRSFRPHAVLMTGGYVAVPVAWAAWRARPRVPVLIYLPDVTPGMAIRFTSRMADRVAVSFPEVARWFPGKAVVTGYPVRPELGSVTRREARASLGLSEDLPVLLVFGGSRGARSINRAVVPALERLLPVCQIVHITGELDWPEVAKAAVQLPERLVPRYHPFPYLHEEMASALSAADLVVARAGASTLGEFPAVGLPSVLSPYPYAGQHQDANAAYLAERGAAIVLPDGKLAAELPTSVMSLLDDKAELARMAAAARKLAQPDAAPRILATLHQLATLVER